MYEQQFNPYAANVDIVKGYFRSGKVLALGILYLISLGLSVATTLMQPVSVTLDRFIGLFDQLGIDSSELSSYYSSAVTESSASTVLSILFSSIITVLTAVAFIIIFAKSRSNDPESTPSGGIGILRVFSVIAFVLSIIVVVLIVIAFVIFIIAISSVNEYFDGDVQKATVFQVIAGLIVSLFIFLLLSFTGSQKNFYRSAKWSLTSVDLETTGSVAYGVYNIIFAIFMGISMIGSAITMITGFSLFNLLSFLTVLVAFIILILTASLALGYNRYIKRQKYGYNDTPYGGAPNGPQDDNYRMPYGGSPQGGYGDNYPNYNMPQQNPSGYYDNGYSCPNCGAPIDGAAPFCPNCGTKL